MNIIGIMLIMQVAYASGIINIYEEYTNCVCFSNNKYVRDYKYAFDALQDATERFAEHIADPRFYNMYTDTNDNNYTTILNIRTREFANYFTTVNKSIVEMNNVFDKLQPELDLIAEDYYDWMLVIAGYVLKREYDSVNFY